MNIHNTLTQYNGAGKVANAGCLGRVAIALIILLIACGIVAAQDKTFEACQVAERTQTETVLQCRLNEKPVTLRFSVDQFWFGSQCATTSTVSGKVYDPPFTLIAGEYQWRHERKPYSLCEIALHQTKRSCIGHDTPHDIPRWVRCPVQNITKP